MHYLGLDDISLELKPTPNRGDVLSALSLAADVAAIFKRQLKQPSLPHFSRGTQPTSLTIVSATPHCTYFVAQKVNGLTIQPSPKWLQDILYASRIRPVNNVVDIGNYVMLVYGQPIHLYDADKLNNLDFTIVDNRQETFLALDHSHYEINQGDLVICAGKQVECIAGIMGSAHSMIEDTTRNIVIEAAIFRDVSIRKTSRRLQLFSDSSMRFLRGIDESRTTFALQQVVTLMQAYASLQEVEEMVVYGEPQVQQSIIVLHQAKLNRLLGSNLSTNEIEAALTRLNFTCTREQDVLTVKVPSYRKDIMIEEDLIEEVIRMVGFDAIQTAYPASNTSGMLSENQKKRLNIRNYLTNNGLHEAFSYSLVAEKEVDDFCMLPVNKELESQRLAMPMSEEHAFMRKSLVPSLLQAVEYNQSRKNADVSLFELSKVYPKGQEGELLAIAISGEMRASKWLESRPADFYQVKGLAEQLLWLLGVEEKRYALQRVEENNPYLHPGRSVYLMEGKCRFGYIGQIHPDMEKKYDTKATFVCELDANYLFSMKTSKTKFQAPSIYPSNRRDIALVVQQDVLASELLRLIKRVGKEKINQLEVFDVYQGEKIDKNKKSIAIMIVYQDASKTMKEEEISSLHTQVVEALIKQYDAELRK